MGSTRPDRRRAGAAVRDDSRGRRRPRIERRGPVTETTRSVPPRCEVVVPRTETHSRRPRWRVLAGRSRSPSADRRLTGSIRESVPSASFATQTVPCRSRTPRSVPDRIVSPTVFVSGSIRATVSSRRSRPTQRPRSRPAKLARCPHDRLRDRVRPGVDPDDLCEPANPTHTLPKPTAIPLGSRPTGIVSMTSPRLGSIARPSRRIGWSPTRFPRPRRYPPGRSRLGIVSTTSFVSGLIRETDGPPLSTTHTASNPTRSPSGSLPPGSSREPPARRVDPRDRSDVGVGHPHGIRRRCDEPRASLKTERPATSPDGVEDPDRVRCDLRTPSGPSGHEPSDRCSEHGERDHHCDRLPPPAPGRCGGGRTDERGDLLGGIPVVRTHRDHVDRLVESLHLASARAR